MYKLILLDFSMPDMDGDVVCIKMKQLMQDAGLVMPYVCCFTAYSEKQYELKALAAGMNEHLVKPISKN